MTEVKIEIKDFSDEVQMQMESLDVLKGRIVSLIPARSPKERAEVDALTRIFEREFYILRAMYKKLYEMIREEKTETKATIYESFYSGLFKFGEDLLEVVPLKKGAQNG